MQKLVRDVERAQLALGDGKKGTYPSEVAPLRKMGKSIFFTRSLAKGSELGSEDIDFRSPGDGVPPYEAAKFIGKPIKREVKAGTKLTPEDF
jgi:N-acetylneuraminate synthase/sialic acid synthase